MADIAQTLGLGRSAIYHYFRNKVDILRALVEQEALQPYGVLAEIAGATALSASERLRRVVVEFVLRRLTGGARLVVLNRLEWEMPEDVEELYTKGRRQILGIFVQLIGEGIAAGEFSHVDSKIAAFTVLGMANWTSRWYSPSGKKSAKEVAELIAEFAIAGLQGAGRPQGMPDSIGGTIKLLKQNLEALERLAG
jgi:AcrR family transcriptional regulator